MKQYITFILFVTVFLFGFSFVQAQEDTTTNVKRAKPSLIRERVDAKRTDTRIRIEDKKSDIQEKRLRVKDRVGKKRSDVKNNLQDKREDAREKFVEKKKERRKKLNEKAKERITAYIKRIIKRLNVALDRFEKIGGRVGSRIEKLEKRGLDMTEARRLLDVMYIKVVEARDDVAQIEQAVKDALDTENPRESFAKVRELIRTAIGSVKDVHRVLVEVIKSVRAGVTDNDHTDNHDNDHTDDDTEVEDN